MAKPIATKTGICFAFPDVLNTPNPVAPPPDIPIPYPNIAQLADAQDASEDVKAGGKEVIREDSSIDSSSGGEPGSNGGVVSGTHLKACTFTSSSGTVKANGKGIVRQGDSTDQNDGNAQGTVMVGNPTVLVGD
jgi:hypothetical protein